MKKEKQKKVKTTVMLDKTLKKFAQVYAIQKDMTLGEVIDTALEEFLNK